MVSVGVLTIGGQIVNDGQSQLLGLGEAGVPYLKAAVMAARNNDFALADSLRKKSPVLGMSTDQEELIYPENSIRADIETLQSQAEKTPSAYLYLKMAYDHYRIKEFEQARLDVQKASDIDPNDGLVKEYREWIKNF